MTDQADTGPIDLAAIEAEWLQPCGSCDAGVTVGCTCSPDDPRNVIGALVAELAAARDQIAAVRSAIERVRELRSCLGAGPMDYELFTDEIDAVLVALSQSGQPTKGEPA